MKTKSLSILLALLLPIGVWAQVTETIVGFEFAGATTDPLPANTIAENITLLSGLNRVGLGASSSANAFGSNGWNITDTFNEADKYIAFSLSVDPGYMVTLTELSWTRLNASNTAPGTGRWGYSINGGSFVLQDTFAITFANAAGVWDSLDIVDATGSIEFRFWAFGTTSVNGGSSAGAGGVTYRNIAGEDLVLNGSVALVPEPSTYALLALSGLALAGYAARRRQRRK
jgi:hypothetical protein